MHTKIDIKQNRHSNTISLTSTTYKGNLTLRCTEPDRGMMGCYGGGLVPCTCTVVLNKSEIFAILIQSKIFIVQSGPIVIR